MTLLSIACIIKKERKNTRYSESTSKGRYMKILSLEASTSSAKAMIYEDGKALCVKSRPYSVRMSSNGRCDGEAVYQWMIDLGRQVAKGHEIDGIGLAGAWHSVMILDGKMQPASDVLTWEYCDAADFARRLRQDQGLKRTMYQTTGCMIHATYPVYKLAHLKEQGMNFDGKHICGQGSYAFYRMTGQWRTSKSMVSGSAFLDVHKLQYAGQALEISGTRESQLPPLCGYENMAPILDSQADALGVPRGIPVLPAYPDGALNQVASGALQEGIMTLSVGTSAALRVSAKKPALSEKMGTWCYVSPVSWLAGAATAGACNCINWAVQMLFGGQYGYAQLEKDPVNVEKCPYFLPFLYGERCPGWNDGRRSTFFQLDGNHTPRDIYYSVQEGVLFHIKQCFEELCHLVGKPEMIMVSGGIVNSNRWMQLLADILELPIYEDGVSQASLLGAAVLAHKAMVPARIWPGPNPQKTFYPHKEAAELLKKRYQTYLEYYAATT